MHFGLLVFCVFFVRTLQDQRSHFLERSPLSDANCTSVWLSEGCAADCSGLHFGPVLNALFGDVGGHEGSSG